MPSPAPVWMEGLREYFQLVPVLSMMAGERPEERLIERQVFSLSVLGLRVQLELVVVMVGTGTCDDSSLMVGTGSCMWVGTGTG